MLSQDHDAVPHEAASDQRVDAPGIVVPEPRQPSAARLLAMTARETDQWRSDARAEAAEIVASARQEAEALLRAAQGEAETVRAESERQRAEAQAEVARLEQVAWDHETRLRRHFSEMLENLDR